jgi:DNA polymerase sigma
LEKFALDLTHAENVFQLLKKTNISQDNSDWIDKELPNIKEYVALVNAKLQMQYSSLSMLHTALKEAEEKKQLQNNNSGCLGVVLVIIVAGISILGTSVCMFI